MNSKEKISKNTITLIITIVGVLLTCAIVILIILNIYIIRTYEGNNSNKCEEKTCTETCKEILTIVESKWTGWSSEQPEDITHQYKIDNNTNTISLNTSTGETHTLKIVKVNKDEITLAVYDLSLKQGKDLEKKGINTLGCKYQEFTIKAGETIELSTCTLDMGTTWKITY